MTRQNYGPMLITTPTLIQELRIQGMKIDAVLSAPGNRAQRSPSPPFSNLASNGHFVHIGIQSSPEEEYWDEHWDVRQGMEVGCAIELRLWLNQLR